MRNSRFNSGSPLKSWALTFATFIAAISMLSTAKSIRKPALWDVIPMSATLISSFMILYLLESGERGSQVSLLRITSP